MEVYKLNKEHLKRKLDLERISNVELSYNAFFEINSYQNFLFVVGEILGELLESNILIFVSVLDDSSKIIGKTYVKVEAEKFEGIGSFKFHIPLNNDIEIKDITIVVCPILEFMNHPTYRLGILPVVGINFPERKPFVKGISIGSEVSLDFEPENPFDENAIRVSDSNGNMLGYIAKEWALLLSKIVDRGSSFCSKATLIEKNPKKLLIEIDPNEAFLEVIKST